MINYNAPTVFKNYESAKKNCVDMEEKEYRIDLDPSGTGKCVIRILDEETGEVIGTL